MNRDTSINPLLPDCQGAYMNIATVFNNLASYMKTELNKAKSIGGTITMVEIKDLFVILENQINNSLSQVTNQRIVIELGGNYENAHDKVTGNTIQNQENNQQIKENTTMKKKQTIRLNESQFNNLVEKVVKESVERVLNESIDNKMELYLYKLTNAAQMLKKISGKSSTDNSQDTLSSRVWNFVNALDDLIFEYGLSDYQTENMSVNENNEDKSVDWEKHDERNKGNSFHGDKLAYKQHLSQMFQKRGESPERQQDFMKATMKHLKDRWKF